MGVKNSRRTTITRALTFRAISSLTITPASTRTMFTRQETITRTSTVTSRSMMRPLHPLTFRTMSQSQRPQLISTTTQDGSTMAPNTIPIITTGVVTAGTGAGSIKSQRSSTTITTITVVAAIDPIITSRYHTLVQMTLIPSQHSSPSASWCS